ncbi:MAG: hypothetical protein DRI95_12965 [Bacteroidetes bacterium]|nr:MAG: hypothetical protein DRI95_12965 [Bacteroidota bacterium]
MKKNVFFIVLLLIFNIISFAQEQYVQVGHGRSRLILDSEGSDVEVHKYLSDEWKAGNLISKENGLQSNIEFRYDIMNDRIEFRSILNPKSVNIVAIGSKFFIYSEFKDEGFVRKGYFEMIYEGKTKLLIRRTANLVHGKKGAYGFKAYTTVIENYYLKIDDNPAIPFNKKKGEIVDLLSNDDLVKKYLKKERLNTKRDKDIIKLLEFYDTL